MIAILFAPTQIPARCLNMAVGMRADPDILPGGRNGQRLDALNVAGRDAACANALITETRTAAQALNAGLTVADIVQVALKHRCGLFCSRSVQSVKQVAPLSVSAAKACSHQRRAPGRVPGYATLRNQATIGEFNPAIGPAIGPAIERDKTVPSAFWKGYLKLSLVTCAVELRPATSDSERVRFHTLNEKTGNRVISRYVDQQSQKPVRDQDQAKGFEKAEGGYIILEDDELEAVALDSTRTIDIDRFVPRDTIGWIWYDKPHFLTPADKVGAEAFAVIREAMDSAGVSGLARLVMYRRERAVLLEPRDKGIVLWTLRYGDEVRDEKDYFSAIEANKPEKKMLTMVRSLIKNKTEDWNEQLLTDPVQKNLKRMIAAKKKKTKPHAASKRQANPSGGGNVIDIMEALRRSLEKDRKK